MCVCPALWSCGYILPCQDHGAAMLSMCSYPCALKLYFIMWEGHHAQSKNSRTCNLGCAIIHALPAHQKTDTLLICGRASVHCACPSI